MLVSDLLSIRLVLSHGGVLILVLVDVGLGQAIPDVGGESPTVLILVLVDVGLGLTNLN